MFQPVKGFIVYHISVLLDTDVDVTDEMDQLFQNGWWRTATYIHVSKE
jgi:hypothetical protein